MHLPPPIMWDPKRTKWDRQALLLLHAFQIYDDSLCSGCAQSSVHALDVANTREFQADTVMCLGCNVRETWTEQHGKDQMRGEKVFVLNNMGGDDNGRKSHTGRTNW